MKQDCGHQDNCPFFIGKWSELVIITAIEIDDDRDLRKKFDLPKN